MHCSVVSKGSGHCLVGWAQPCLGHHDCPSYDTHACGQSFSGNQGSGIPLTRSAVSNTGFGMLHITALVFKLEVWVGPWHLIS